MNSTKQNSKKISIEEFNCSVPGIQFWPILVPRIFSFFRVGFTIKVCFLGDGDKPKNIDSSGMMDIVGADFHDLLHFYVAPFQCKKG